MSMVTRKLEDKANIATSMCFSHKTDLTVV